MAGCPIGASQACSCRVAGAAGDSAVAGSGAGLEGGETTFAVVDGSASTACEPVGTAGNPFGTTGATLGIAVAFMRSLPRCLSHATSPVNMNPPRMTPSAEHLARNVCIEKTLLRYCLTGGQRSRGRPDKYALCRGACGQSVPCQRPIKAINTMRRAGHADKKPTK